MKYTILLIFLTGCASNTCELSLEQLRPAEKIPKIVNIQIDDVYKTDTGGVTLIHNYSVMKHQIDAVIRDCR